MKRPGMIPIGFERAEIERLRQKFESLLAVLEESLDAGSMEFYGAFLPVIDLRENDKAIMISVELPGIKPQNITLKANSKEITIEGIRDSDAVAERIVSHYCCERRFGEFRRSIQLRWAVDLSGAKAVLTDGLLEIYLPKLVERRGKIVKIDITAE